MFGIIGNLLLLQRFQTQSAWETLANYGNMSSSTFLFVLDQLAQQTKRQTWTAGLGFGPGLSIEGILLG
jgi:predicted naringenin-chalcone synthase